MNESWFHGNSLGYNEWCSRKKEFHSFLLKKAWNSFKIIGQRLKKLCWLIVSFHVSFIHKTKITKYFSAQHDLYIEKSKFYKWFLFENGLFWCHERKSIISSKKSWGRIKVVKFSLKAMFATKILHLEKGSTGVVKIIMDGFQENLCNMNIGRYIRIVQL